MDIAYLYSKARTEFGKAVRFDDEPSELFEVVTTSATMSCDDLVMQQPLVTCVDTGPSLSMHEVNTERLLTWSTGMTHREGGWPKEIDPREKQETARYRKKLERDEDFRTTVTALAPVVMRVMKQNNTVDLYENYFENDLDNHTAEATAIKSLAVFRDPSSVTRTAASVNWHPEGPSKIAVAYSILKFQDPLLNGGRCPRQSYIWDVLNPNGPDRGLLPPSPMLCLKYNPKQPEVLAGGCHNGLVAVFDTRRAGAGSCDTSTIEQSHHDPVYDVFWPSSKAGFTLASCSTDGRLLWWDIRKLALPTDQVSLTTAAGGQHGGPVVGASSMEYSAEAGASKYLVGTEQGTVCLVNLRARKAEGTGGVTAFDTGQRHHGPVTAVMRNPAHPKFFLTVGDWTARVWTEDLKTPIMATRFASAPATAGCWSPTRPGVFFVAKADGGLDVWDIFFRSSAPALEYRVTTTGGGAAGGAPGAGQQQLPPPPPQQQQRAAAGLSCIAVSAQAGRLVATGDTSGAVHLLEVSDGLAVPQASERIAVGGLFEREFKQEKALEAREREMRRAQAAEAAETAKPMDTSAGKAVSDGVGAAVPRDKSMAKVLKKVEKDFLTLVREAEAAQEAADAGPGDNDDDDDDA